jgi:succinoglycan biosynthesis transport protein ExoP
MDIKQYITPLLRWWWLLVVATLVAATSSYLAVRQQPPIYQAYATLMIGRLIQDPNPNSGEFYLVQQLAATYAEIGNREPVRQKVMEALGLSFLPSTSVSALPNSSMISIAVTDTDPKRARAVANELARQLILTSPTGSNPEDQTRQQFVNEQLDQLQSQIKDTNAEIEKLQQQLGDLNSARQISDMQTQINAQQQKLTTMQSNYASLLSTTQSGATNTLSIIEAAGLPRTPIGPNKKMTVALASAIGLTLAALAAYLIEFLDRGIKTTEQISRLVQFPVIGYIGNAGRSGWNHVIENPRSLISEEFRSLRTNLEFSGVDKPLKTILITSPDAGDGKTLVAANLALILSQTEKKVILVDCDLRKPDVHRALGIKSRPGLAEVFREQLSVSDAIHNVDDQQLSVIPAGSVPPNPAELLGSKRMKQILGTLSEIYDIVILDCAPLRTTDALVLSAQVDGVVMVTRYAHTTENAIQAAAEQLKRANTRIVGVILNRIPSTSSLAYRYHTIRYYGRAEESQAISTDTVIKRLNARKIIPNLISIIKKTFQRKRKDVELDLTADDYLFTNIFSSQEQESVNTTNPSDKMKRD